ncbi:hypothetical protein [Plastoroseomonas hellenica]|uniref:hypothetical protein n=1 Tax=Plastoroseomonas hellenica TaxID=2687306 RepID=UPI001BA68489|nr:hypothetical protein [Plastoroseomonas hellenica]MBR0641292.1 hypothetical protein [Plastoroseomonas hellenica]
MHLQIWTDLAAHNYGPMNHAFAALDTAGQSMVEEEIRHVLTRINRGRADTLSVPSEYLEVVITPR